MVLQGVIDNSNFLYFIKYRLLLLMPSYNTMLRLLVIAFACNTKRFAIAILFFLFLFPSSVLGRTAKSFLANALRLVSLEAFKQDSTHSLDTLKYISVKIFPRVVFCHRTLFAHGNQDTQHPKQHKK